MLVDSLEDARGGIRGEPMHIELKPDAEIKPVQIYTTRQVPIHYDKAYKKIIKELLSPGILVRELKSTKWTSRAHFVPKPVPPGVEIRLRLVTDYREYLWTSPVLVSLHFCYLVADTDTLVLPWVSNPALMSSVGELMRHLLACWMNG